MSVVNMSDYARYYFLSFVLTFLVVTPALAATTYFTANGNFTVTGVTFDAGTTDMIIFNNSTAASWSFNSGALTVTNPGSSFEVGSSNSSVMSIKITQNGNVLACANNTTPGTSYVTLPTVSAVYSVVPSATTCPIATTTTPIVTSGASGSISAFPYPKRPIGNFTATITSLKDSNEKKLLHFGFGNDITKIIIANNTSFRNATSTSVRKTLEWTHSKTGMLYIKYCNKYSLCSDPVSVSTSAVNSSLSLASSSVQHPTHLVFLFDTNLYSGMDNNNVRNLQKTLSSNKNIYPQGLITGYFGPLTEKAVERFQTEYKIVSSGTPSTTGYGLVGPRTRAMLRSISEKTSSIVSKQTSSKRVVDTLIIHTLYVGMNSPEVKQLQQLLNTDRTTALAKSGNGSTGKETDYFGPLTEKAVERFQTEYKIVSSGTPSTTGYGLVGPRTRAMLSKVFGHKQ